MPHPLLASFARAIFEADNSAILEKNPHAWDGAESPHKEYAYHIANRLLRAGWGRVDRLRPMLEALVDPIPCDRDHDGGCQSHGYLSLKPESECPQAELKNLLAESAPKKAGPQDFLCHGGCGNFVSWEDANEQGWMITTTSTKDSNDPGAHLRCWCPNCGPWGGQYAKD